MKIPFEKMRGVVQSVVVVATGGVVALMATWGPAWMWMWMGWDEMDE
jgi:hypothetical protein